MHAAAGMGKTSLLRHFADAKGALWLDAETAENDHVELVRTIFAAAVFSTEGMWTTVREVLKFRANQVGPVLVCIDNIDAWEDSDLLREFATLTHDGLVVWAATSSKPLNTPNGRYFSEMVDVFKLETMTSDEVQTWVQQIPGVGWLKMQMIAMNAKGIPAKIQRGLFTIQSGVAIWHLLRTNEVQI